MGGGCKNDGGPLWVTVQLVDDPDIGGGAGSNLTVWARIFQKKPDPVTASSRKRKHRFNSNWSQVNSYDYYEDDHDEKHDHEIPELVECMALQLCTTTDGS